MIPDCCLCCKFRNSGEKPEDICQPDYVMTAIMIGKCQGFESRYNSTRASHAVKHTSRTYKLGYENGT